MKKRLKRVGVIILMCLVVVGLTAWGFDLASAQGTNREGQIAVGGLQRTFMLHLPPNQASRLPLVMVLHGGGGQGQGMDKLTGFNALADSENFAVVYPDGYQRNWSDGRIDVVLHRNVDDVGFLSALIDKLIQEDNIDPQRVYVTGISNGGFMAQRMACDAADRVAAVASVAATFNVDMVERCKPARAIPIMFIFGSDDPIVPPQGGEVVGERGEVLSITEAVQYWTKLNQCAENPQVTSLPNRALLDGTTVTLTRYSACQSDSSVVYDAIQGGGHTWPGGLQYLPRAIVGQTSRDLDATQAIWDFFKRESLSKRGSTELDTF